MSFAETRVSMVLIGALAGAGIAGGIISVLVATRSDEVGGSTASAAPEATAQAPAAEPTKAEEPPTVPPTAAAAPTPTPPPTASPTPPATATATPTPSPTPAAVPNPSPRVVSEPVLTGESRLYEAAAVDSQLVLVGAGTYVMPLDGSAAASLRPELRDVVRVSSAEPWVASLLADGRVGVANGAQQAALNGDDAAASSWARLAVTDGGDIALADRLGNLALWSPRQLDSDADDAFATSAATSDAPITVLHSVGDVVLYASESGELGVVGQPDPILPIDDTCRVTAMASTGTGFTAIGYDNGVITVWDTIGLQPVATTGDSAGPCSTAASGAAARSLGWSPDGSFLAAGGGDGQIRLLTFANSRLERHPWVMNGHAGRAVIHVRFASDSELLTVDDQAGSLAWDISGAAAVTASTQ